MRGLGTFCAVLIAALLALVPAPAAAQTLVPLCHAGAASTEPLAALVARPDRWRCDGARPSLVPERTVLRFAVRAGAPPPDHFATRAHPLSAVTVALVRGDAVIGERRHEAGAIRVGGHGDTIRLPIPGGARDGDIVLAAIDGPTTAGLFAHARLLRESSGWSWEEMRLLLGASLVGGLLLMPLAFHVAYYRVLRERFMLWYLLLSSALIVQCFLNSGIFGLFVPIPLPLHAALGTASFGIGVAAAAAFGAAFIEPARLNPRLRRLLYGAAAVVVGITAAHVAFPMVGRAWQTTAFFVAFAPVLVLFCTVLVDALRRGSRAVYYQLVAWSPFIVVGAVRIVTMALPGAQPRDAMALFFAAMVIQSVATTLGVADRLVSMKRQRDRAMTRAQSLERLSERDDLTGLYNRRALDGALGDFVRQRFTGFALFDLDHFKRVNDTHGHAVGDAVLRVTADVLGAHGDSVAVRLGGEEFLLLLRGSAVTERVERLREALPVRIAREVQELQTLVTASTGLIDAPDGIGDDFPHLYQTADDLLYEAKHNGRNLMAAITVRDEGMAAPAAFAAA